MTVNQDVCLGKDACGLCLEACPYRSPQFEDEADAKMQKGNFCVDRIEANKKPIWVDACPMRALDAGSLDELKSKYGNFTEAEGFVYSPEIKPSNGLKPPPKAS